MKVSQLSEYFNSCKQTALLKGFIASIKSQVKEG
jgi:hypothetical protein